MPKNIPPLQENKKPFHQRNGSGELHVFEAAHYFAGVNENFIGTNGATLAPKHEGVRRLSLDIPNNRINSIPLPAVMMEKENPMMIKNEKKSKQPSSPGGKLAHFLNSLFNQTSSSKKSKSTSKSKSTTSAQSMKDEDESPGGWRRKRSSISLFRSGNSNTNTTVHSRTPPPYHIPQASPKSTTDEDLRSHSDHKTACEITKIPINGNHDKNENLNMKSEFSEKKTCSGNNGLSEKVRVCDDHHQKYDPTMEIRALKRFILDDDDDGDSDSSSDLFELTNCDLGYYSSGLPVFETTHMDSIKRGAPISS